jgi:DNA polymerase-1
MKAPSPASTTRPLLAIDAPAVLYRAFYSVPPTVKDPEGRPINALLGAANTLLSIAEAHGARAVVFCLGAESATYRTELYPPYHAQRPPMPKELESQFDAAPAFFRAFGWHVMDSETLEADDLVHSLAQSEAEAGGEGLIVTIDRDLFQSVGERVAVLLLQKGGAPPERIGPAQVVERYGVRHDQVPDFIALRGDPSDNIPGAKGIGAKTARDLLVAHDTLEGVFERCLHASSVSVRAILQQKDLLLKFRDVATVRRVDLGKVADTPIDAVAAAAAARLLGMNRLATRLEKAGGIDAPAT